MPRALLLLAAPLSRHVHVSPAHIALAVALTVVIAALTALALPTRPCPRCDGQRIQITRHWLTGQTRTRPCRPCSGTGRLPRRGARLLHRLIWSVRAERHKP